jgi:hypothetical protein
MERLSDFAGLPRDEVEHRVTQSIRRTALSQAGPNGQIFQ